MNMNESHALEAMADALVSSGRASAAQAAEWKASDLAALSGGPAAPAPGTPAATMDDRINELVKTGQYTQQQAADVRKMIAAAPQPTDGEQGAAPAPAPAEPAPLSSSGAPAPWADVELPDGFGEPAKPTDYRLDAVIADQLTTDQLRNLGETLHIAKLPAPIAVQMVSEIASVAAQNLDEKGLNLMTQRTMAQLHALWGDETDTKINTARTFVKSLDKARPGVLRLLDDSGAGSSYAVIRQLVSHAERLNAARRR